MKLTDEQAIEYMYQNGYFDLKIADYITKRLNENEQLQAQAARMREALKQAREILQDMVDVADACGSAYLYKRDTGKVIELLAAINKTLGGDPD